MLLDPTTCSVETFKLFASSTRRTSLAAGGRSSTGASVSPTGSLGFGFTVGATGIFTSAEEGESFEVDVSETEGSLDVVEGGITGSCS